MGHNSQIRSDGVWRYKCVGRDTDRQHTRVGTMANRKLPTVRTGSCGDVQAAADFQRSSLISSYPL
jgi:hypothetical protein